VGGKSGVYSFSIIPNWGGRDGRIYQNTKWSEDTILESISLFESDDGEAIISDEFESAVQNSYPSDPFILLFSRKYGISAYSQGKNRG